MIHSILCCCTVWYRYGSILILSNDIKFVDLMTAMLALMLGALGLGQAMNDMTDQKEGLAAMKRIYETVGDSLNCSINSLSSEGEESHRAIARTY